jgi:hypothetical protein
MWKSRLLLSLLLVAAVHAEALTVVPVDVPTQVDRAELIFVGTVVEVKSVPVKDGSTAYTYVTFAVEETLKGAASGPTLTLRFYGGQAGGYVYEIAGAPKFKEGGKHLLFVEANERYMIPLTGGPQGKLDLVAHPVTQEPIVVDGSGRAIDGLREKNWSRSGLQFDRLGQIRRQQAAARVVSEEGVKIELEGREVASQAADNATPAPAVIAELRSLIHSRAFAPEFRRAPVVQSASPSNVPETNPHKQFRRATAQ